MSDHLPPEVLFEIFSRLPVKSLLRFRSVSKHWRSTISSLHFFKAHLANSSERPCLLFSGFCLDYSYIEHFTLHPRHRTIEDYSEFECPLKNKAELKFVGSCNGLFCLSDRPGSAGKESIIVWNPSIRRYATLPSTRFPDYTDIMSCICFGFDLISKDYKVIRTITFRGQLGIQTTPPPMTEVYTLGRGCWKAISSDCPFHCIDNLLWEQVYTNGVCLRIGLNHVSSSADDHHILLLSFDLGDEVFRVIDTPVEMNGSYPADVGIRLFQDMVSVFRVQERGNDSSTVSIWVMRDYGVVESWTKQYSFNYGGDLDFSMWIAYERLFACQYVESLALLGGSKNLQATTHCGDYILRNFQSQGRDVEGGEDAIFGIAARSVASIAGLKVSLPSKIIGSSDVENPIVPCD